MKCAKYVLLASLRCLSNIYNSKINYYLTIVIIAPMVNTHSILCHTTVKTHKQAKTLATRIIQNKLGACVQIKPVESIYAWEEKLAHEEEFQLAIKTQSSLKKSLMNFIKQEHDYSLPEIIFVPIIDGEPDYLDWVHANSGEP